jgi:sugar lactone lactonase YvrE
LVSVTVVSGFKLIQSIKLDSLHNDPIALVVASDTTFYIAYRGNNSNGFVGVFDKTGHNTLIIGNGLFTQLYDVVLDSKGNVYTADPDQNIIRKFSNHGDTISQWQVQRPVRILSDTKDNLFVLYSDNPYLISKFDTSGNRLAIDTAVSVTGGIAVSSDGRIFMNELYTSSILIITNDLSARSYAPFLLGSSYSALLNIDSKGNFYVIDGNNDYGKISVFNSAGEKIAQWCPGITFNKIVFLGKDIYVLGDNAAANAGMDNIRVFSSPF